MSAGSPLVSILVPAFNAAPYLPELCRAIQAQTCQNFEALILDDGSTDGTSAVLAPFRNDSRFKIFDGSPNRGVHAATSALLTRMQGEYWCRPDADDVIHPDFVAQRLGLLQSHPEAMMVHGPSEYIDASGGPSRIGFPNLKVPASMSGARGLSVLLQHNIIRTSSIFVRSEVTRQVLPRFQGDWKFAEDWYLWMLHAATGFDLLWDDQILVKYRVHERSLSWEPALAATRQAAIRLVPLCALNAAAQFSPLAADLWSRWRPALYQLWLFRAARLRAAGQLRAEWLRLAASAYDGRDRHRVSLFRELCKHGWRIPMTGMRERQAMRKQSFRVSGIAQINDPIFE